MFQTILLKLFICCMTSICVYASAPAPTILPKSEQEKIQLLHASKAKFLKEANELSGQWINASNLTAEQKEDLQKKIKACAVEFIKANITCGITMQKFFDLARKNEALRAKATEQMSLPKGIPLIVGHKVENPVDFFDFFSQSVFVNLPYEKMMFHLYKQAEMKLKESTTPQHINKDLDSLDRPEIITHGLKRIAVNYLAMFIQSNQLSKEEYLQYMKRLATRKNDKTDEGDQGAGSDLLIKQLESLYAEEADKNISFEDFLSGIYDQSYDVIKKDTKRLAQSYKNQSATGKFVGLKELPKLYETFQWCSREYIRTYLRGGGTIQGFVSLMHATEEKIEKKIKVTEDEDNILFGLQACHAGRSGKKIPFFEYVKNVATTEDEHMKKEQELINREKMQSLQQQIAVEKAHALRIKQELEEQRAHAARIQQELDQQKKEVNIKKNDGQTRRHNENLERIKNKTIVRYAFGCLKKNVKHNKEKRNDAVKKMDLVVQKMVTKRTLSSMHRWQAYTQKIKEKMQTQEVTSILHGSQKARAFKGWLIQAQQNRQARKNEKIRKRAQHLSDLAQKYPAHAMALHDKQYYPSQIVEALDLNLHFTQKIDRSDRSNIRTKQENALFFKHYEQNNKKRFQQHIETDSACATCKIFGMVQKK